MHAPEGKLYPSRDLGLQHSVGAASMSGHACIVSYSMSFLMQCPYITYCKDSRHWARVTSKWTGVETLQKWVYSIHPTTPGAS